MDKKILYVVNELPYPARNGVTIPSFHYLRGLVKENVDIDILYLPRGNDLKKDEFITNQNFVRNIHCIPLKRKSLAKIIFNQILFVEPSYFGYTYNKRDLEKELKEEKYDIIIYTPISATIIQRDLRNYLKREGISVGILSDCYSYALKVMAKLDNKVFRMKLKDRMISKIKLLEGRLQEPLERKIVNKLDIILCQTKVDELAFRNLGFSKRVLVLSNGVDSGLRHLTIEQSPVHKVLFMGILNGKYEYVANWLVLKAWPEIHRRYPTLVLKLVGKGLNIDLQNKIKNDESIEYISYVKSLTEVYLDSQILLAPIFMRCGLINKTIEAMAAGLVVVGDETAFNGLPNFKPNVHGYQFRTLEEMIFGLDKLLMDEVFYNSIRINAKQLINDNFDWENKTKEFNSVILNKVSISSKDQVNVI